MRSRRIRRLGWGVFCICVLLAGFGSAPARANENVDITFPASISFVVTNSSGGPVIGSPAPSTISFHSLKLVARHQLQIQVKAESITFTPTNGTPIPADNVAWTTSNAVNGTGSNGTLSASEYRTVYISTVRPNSGSVDLTWRLTPPGSGSRAGTYTLVLRWYISSI